MHHATARDRASFLCGSAPRRTKGTSQLRESIPHISEKLERMTTMRCVKDKVARASGDKAEDQQRLRT